MSNGMASAALLLVVPMLLAAVELWDPTRPPDAPLEELGMVGASSYAPGPLYLSSILISPERRLATINGQRVRTGEQVGSARVLEITPVSVRVELEGEILDLYLAPRLKTPTSREKEQE